MYGGNLRRAFESLGRGQYAVSDTILFAAVASHYIQDAHQPLHASINFDGQTTGQIGIHARFETTLFDRFQSRLAIQPPALKPIEHPRDTAFEILLESYRLVQPMLDADKDAVAGKDTYDDEYFEKFFSRVKPMLERRIGESIAATASVIVGAWEAAGKPALKTDMPRTVQKVKK